MSSDLTQYEERMRKGVESYKRDLSNIRAGKANASLLDGITVDYYGTPTPINQVATISVPEARLLVVAPWEKNLLKEIAKSILGSDLDLNPQDDGSVLKIPIPQLNEDRRRDMVKQANKMTEDARIAVRNVRRDANEGLKKAQKAGEISEDDSHRLMDQVQKLHDKFIAEIEDVFKKKEAEVMEV
ncbi:MAG: ribosome recycling factor [Candidatus Eisenbacteria bacterium]|uniref:Ribosome-recycling factor n=1 Tax=Eiseniibacteriota bacterium TaxID=2212470 RepID=A0A7Y2H2W2_UNCEI|nr:ribosome recycling factor [Candidatus Eisenbacteria bacterium]